MNNELIQKNETTDSIMRDIENPSLKKECDDIIPKGKIHYVYHLIDPKTKLPFYIGKGKKTRIYDHEKYTLKGKIPNNNKHLFYKIQKVLLESGFIKYYIIFHSTIENESMEVEKSEIKKYGRLNNDTGILCNMTDGGESFSGFKQSLKHIEKRAIGWRKWYERVKCLDEYKKIGLKASKKLKVLWKDDSFRKSQIEKLKKSCWKYGKDHHSYGKILARGRENKNYKILSSYIIDEIVRLYKLGNGRRKIQKEILKKYNLKIEPSKFLKEVKLEGIKLRSLSEINELKRKVLTEDMRKFITHLFVVEKIGVVKISKELLEKFGFSCGHGPIRKFLKREGIYVRGQYTK